MAINPNGSIRNAGIGSDKLGADEELAELANKVKNGGVSDTMTVGKRNLAVTGAQPSGLKAPPLPGGNDPATIADPLASLGLGRENTSPEAVTARAEIRKALGMPENAPLTEQSVAAAIQKKEPEVLEALKGLGLTPGTSLSDPATKEAIKKVQEALGVEQTGNLDLETLLAIVEAHNNQRNQASGARPSPRASSSGGGGGGGGGGVSNMGSHNAPGEPKRNLWQKTQDFAHDKLGVGPGSAPTGNLRANQKEAYDAAIKEGLSPTAAKALVANMTGESLSDPGNNHWDVSHMSQGIVQWDPSRAAAIKREFGKEPKDMTVAEQTKAAIWEMKNHYPKTYAALQGNDPQAMISALVRDYERPANPSGEIDKRMGHYNNLGNLGS